MTRLSISHSVDPAVSSTIPTPATVVVAIRAQQQEREPEQNVLLIPGDGQQLDLDRRAGFDVRQAVRQPDHAGGGADDRLVERRTLGAPVARRPVAHVPYARAADENDRPPSTLARARPRNADHWNEDATNRSAPYRHGEASVIPSPAG
jgi:hypothetical protein